ncbi:cytochrome c biogenesis protein CcsA [Alteromonas sp. 5E99-2]|uniref:cytochrome C assembly family protein n=1 Tax=Alteromonas sp. 5E99-2 TaxID=2817683 RepID=UPI001A98B49F|nr:cytochrome c biogenesis protein CcsA [Alteromonas sp. 5E99-2]MBO1256093.1 cytochrome c biogenesis protein CcsA [Alteromonas sp. 5E99-2]
MKGLLVAITMCLYFFTTLIFLRRIVKNKSTRPLDYSVAAFAVVIHALILIMTLSKGTEQGMSMTNVLSLVSWIISVSMLIGTRFVSNTLLLPGVSLFAGLSVLVTGLVPPNITVTVPLSAGMITHVTLSLLAYGCLSIAFLYAIQMMMIRSKLKHKGKALINSTLPPLMLVESFLFGLTLVGSMLLLAALATGFVFIDSMFSTHYAHKTVLSILALGVYTLLLIGQRAWGWKNKQVVTLISIGLALLTLAYFGSRFVREVLL